MGQEPIQHKSHTHPSELLIWFYLCVFSYGADDGTSSAVIDMEYFKRSSVKFQRFLVSEEYSYFLSWELDLSIDTNTLYNLIYNLLFILCF